MGPLYDDSVDLSVVQLQQRAYAMVNAHNIAFLLIDNIHCIRLCSTSRRHNDQMLQMGEMSDTLKMLAQTLNIPILVLAPYASLKVNNSVVGIAPSHQGLDSRKRDADHALFLYREDVSQRTVQDKTRSLIPLLIANHRNGFVTDIVLSSQSQQTNFPDDAHASLLTSQNDVAS